ncbi:relaxase/mobilization nuclease domain-containing protein [Actinomadura oligospora]|uniref:relaxase/mobilization nuclease domain-containing protein n=1 Tax=Actinomadura oligospora TaxID=111804 RepID=UPI0012F8DF3D|nr:hypothetical protein [Actinomadura oligospora]
MEGLLRYLFGPGTDGEHRDAHVVAGFDAPGELEPSWHPNGGRDLRQLDALLTQPVKQLGERSYRKPVWHLSLRAAPEDPILTDAQWARITDQIMDRVGLAPDGDPDAVRWIAVRHADDHIHVVATLARTDGIRPDVWNDGHLVREACRAAEDEYGLRRTAPADRTAARRATRAEHEKARRSGRTEDPRTTLRRHVQEAAAAARTESEFYELLHEAGVLVRHRYSQRNPNQVTGYAVALPAYRTASGPAVWYGGGKLAADLTLPKLRTRWSANSPPVSGRGLDERTVRAYLRTTVRQAADSSRTAADFLAHLDAAGIIVKTRRSIQDPNSITGYAVTLPDHHDAQGQPAWYSGGKLAAALSWTNLCRAWSGIPSPTPGVELSADERRAIYNDAARAAAFATAEIRRHTVTNPHAARDACWATADLLHSAAQATGNHHLARAADAYDRAARAPHGRIPHPTPSGNRLRSAARIMAIARTSGSPGIQILTVLAAAMLTLIDTIADLHHLHRREAQSDGAKAARRSLSEVIHDGTPWFTADQSRQQSPVAVAMADVPHPWAPPVLGVPQPSPGGVPGTRHSQLSRRVR